MTSKAHVFKQRLLERAQLNFDRAEQGEVIRGRVPRAASKLRGVIGREVPALPVTREDRSHLCDCVWITRRRDADVPLEPDDLRRMSQVR